MSRWVRHLSTMFLTAGWTCLVPVVVDCVWSCSELPCIEVWVGDKVARIGGDGASVQLPSASGLRRIGLVGQPPPPPDHTVYLPKSHLPSFHIPLSPLPLFLGGYGLLVTAAVLRRPSQVLGFAILPAPPNN